MGQFGNCGRKACYASARMVIGIATSVKDAARLSGVSNTTVDKIYDAEGFVRPAQRNAQKRLPDKIVREAWADMTRDHRSIAASLNISGHGLYERAKRLGLPPRKSGRIKNLIEWPEDFNEMWAAGVWCVDIMQACPRPPKSYSSVTIEAKKRGLKPRGSGPKSNGISLAWFRMVQDAKRANALAKARWYGDIAA